MEPSLIRGLNDRPEVHELLLQAEKLESNYEWALAVQLYQRILNIATEPPQGSAVLKERCGYAAYRSGMQASTKVEFRETLIEAISYYTAAIQTLRSSLEEIDIARTHRCEAFVSYLHYWLASTSPEKFEMLDKAWASTRECLKIMNEIEAGQEYAVTYNQSSIIPWLRYFFPQAKKARLESMREAIEHGQNVIRSLQDTEHRVELAKSYVNLSSFLGFIGDIEPGSARDSVQSLRKYWKRAKELSEETALVESSKTGGGLDYEDTMEGRIKSCERILPYVLKTRDNFLIGLTYDWMAMFTALRSPITDDSEIGATLMTRAMSHARSAKARYDVISLVSPRAGVLWVEFPEPEYLLTMSWFQADPSRKRAALDKAAKALPVLLRIARSSMYPESIVDAHHVCSKTMLFLSKLEQDTKRKRKFLRQALFHRRETIRIQKEAWGESGIYQVLPLSYLGDVRFELAKTFTSPFTVKRLVEQAIDDKISALHAHSSDQNALLRETAEDYYFDWSARIHSDIGTFSSVLFEISGYEDKLRKAAQEFVEAAGSFQTLKRPSRVAESHMSAAQCYSLLTDHAHALEHFEKAKMWYQTASTTIPALAHFYKNQIIYMDAWSRIEKARDYHEKRQCALAASLYDEAARRLQSTRSWSYLSSKYRALSQMESGEDKSRRELSDEAILEFEAASRAFLESLIAIQMRLKDLESLEETQMAFDLLKKSRLRAEYCDARAEIERARLLSKKGDFKQSGQRYGRAVEILDRVAAELSRSPEKKEVQFVGKLSGAWQTMARAEDEVAPSLSLEASEQFRQSKDLSPSENTRLLVLGHSNYCCALEKVSRFLETGKPSDQAAAIRHLETATRHYLKAGFDSASENARATKRFFEGQVLLNLANRERDSEKKAQIYSAAEKILRSASNSFGELAEVAKRDDVLRILERVGEEKDLALSIVSKMASPVILSTHTIPIIASSGESAVGVEVFRSAYVQASLVASPINPKIGEPLKLRIELANAGMSSAQLIRLEKVIPEGFEIIENPGKFSIKDHHLILKGRRLEPLKTEELSLVLKPNVEGPLELKPRILYLDENGESRVHEPDPVEIIVQDHGGTSQINLPVPEQTLQDSPIIKFLTASFIEDYMRRRLSLEHAGWRGLPDIVRSLEIPRSHVYGDSRYRHTFGKPLERLVQKGIVEYRVFTGRRGRGGNIVKVRVAYEKEPVKRFVDSLALTLST